MGSFHVELVESGGEWGTLDVWGQRDRSVRRDCAISDSGGAHARLVRGSDRWYWVLILTSQLGDEPFWLDPGFEPRLFRSHLALDDFWAALEGGGGLSSVPQVTLSPTRSEPVWVYPDGREVTWSRWTPADEYRVPTRVEANWSTSVEAELHWEYVRSDDSDEDLREWCPEALQRVMDEAVNREPGGQ
ncbi:MAG: hypothetical protein ABMA64_28630 [Myxococcota bacterium]